jgi:DNA polymerase-1
VFREFELREPLRRLEEALGEQEAAPRRPASSRSPRRLREATLADLSALPAGTPVAVAMRPPETPEGELVAGRRRVALRRGPAAGDRCGRVLVGSCARPAAVVAALDGRPSSPTTPRRSATCRRTSRTTRCSAPTCSSPARRAFPLSRARGGARDRHGRRGSRSPRTPSRIAALAGWQREQLADRGLEPVMAEIELPLVGVLRAMERAGVRLHRGRFAEIKQKVDEEIARLEREVWDLAGEEFVLGSPQQLGHVLFEKLGLSKKRRGKTGFSTTRASCRRSATSIRSSR